MPRFILGANRQHDLLPCGAFARVGNVTLTLVADSAVGPGQSSEGGKQQAAAGAAGGKGGLRFWRCLQLVQSLLKGQMQSSESIFSYTQVILPKLSVSPRPSVRCARGAGGHGGDGAGTGIRRSEIHDFMAK